MIPPASREISPGVNLGTELKDRFFAFLSSWSSGPTNNHQYVPQSTLAINQQSFFFCMNPFSVSEDVRICAAQQALSRAFLTHR